MENMVPALDNVPVGFRFRPTDEELVSYYLRHKLLDDDYPIHIIPEIDVCKFEPWELPDFSVIKSDDPEWFFFSPVGYKYSNSRRVNRTTKCGFWKATGNDRKIKVRGTNDVIGAKKTLVFHRGRVPKGVNTNWVIHEYHAVTFPEGQRNFVLCRLMKKANKRGADASICDEGEPSASRHMVSSDYENPSAEDEIPTLGAFDEMDMVSIFPLATHEAEEHFPCTMQQSSIGVEQEDFSLPDVYFRNDMQTPLTEEEAEFVDSILVDDPEFVLSEERRHAFVTSSAQSESLRRVYNENSDTDIEVVSALYRNIVDTSTVSNEHPSSTPKMFVHHLSINREANRERKDSIIRDDTWEVETSSCDSNADKPLENNYVDVSSSPSTLRRWKTQHHPGPDNFIARRNVTRRSQTRRVVSQAEDQKKLTIVESEKDTLSRENLEARSRLSSDVTRKYFIFADVPSSSQSLYPPSVYLVNVVIGIFLLIAISWDVLSL